MVHKSTINNLLHFYYGIMKCFKMSGNTKISVINLKIHQKKYGPKKTIQQQKNGIKLGPKFHTRNENLALQ